MKTTEELKKLRWEDMRLEYKDKEVLGYEILFIGLTLANIFIVNRIFSDVCPYPIFLTLWQLAQSLGMGYILGEAGIYYSKLRYFPKFNFDPKLLPAIVPSTFLYAVMLICANVLLYSIPTIASYPVIISISVIFHHIVRFVLFGEEYMPMRWQSIGLISAAFLISLTDRYSINFSNLPFIFLFGLSSALYRAGYLHKIIHLADPNTLHTNQSILATGIAGVLFFLFGEWRVFFNLPFNLFSLYTYHIWGCLITVGTIPFLKNIVANRLIKKTGNATWRFLELATVALTFLIGITIQTPSFQPFIAILLLIAGRGLGAADVIIAQANIPGETRGGGLQNHQQSDADQNTNGPSALPHPTLSHDFDEITTPYAQA